jgi:hypothetical protein
MGSTLRKNPAQIETTYKMRNHRIAGFARKSRCREAWSRRPTRTQFQDVLANDPEMLLKIKVVIEKTRAFLLFPPNFKLLEKSQLEIHGGSEKRILFFGRTNRECPLESATFRVDPD